MFDASVQSEKYLIWLQADIETMKKRVKGRTWTEDSIERWKDEVLWENPRQNGYKLIVYQNNTPEDLEHIKADLRRQLT